MPYFDRVDEIVLSLPFADCQYNLIVYEVFFSSVVRPFRTQYLLLTSIPFQYPPTRNPEVVTQDKIHKFEIDAFSSEKIVMCSVRYAV
jgi:hypothetical protein